MLDGIGDPKKEGRMRKGHLSGFHGEKISVYSKAWKL